jgi:gamma-glutamyltranspeptidase
MLLPLLDARGAETHTTNVSVVDADGNACAFTTSLGLGSGDFLPGLDLHLNSMLGESDLIVGGLTPGQRMQSMMAPCVAVDGGGLTLVAGAAGGTRLRTALALVLAGVLDEGLEARLGSIARGSTRRTQRSTPSRASTTRRSSSSRPTAAAFAAGRRATTISAA